MNFDVSQIESLKDLLRQSRSVLILIPQNPKPDQVASALALYLSLEKLELKPTIACPSQMTVIFNRLFGVDKITDKIGSRNLIISFDYVKDSIEKVSYNIEEGKFNLVIEPKEEAPVLDPKKVNYDYSGAEADLVIVCGAKSLADLGEWKDKESQLLTKKPVVNLTTEATENFGQVNLVQPAAALSELTTHLFKKLELPINPDMATNLLAGLETATAKFSQPQVGADTFRAAAWLLDQGAKQGYLSQLPRPGMNSINSLLAQKKSLSTQPSLAAQAEPEAKPSPDWLQPKVYKGNTQF